MPAAQTTSQKLAHHAYALGGMAVGAFFEALAIRLFLVPNELIDGGVIGISLILARIFHHSYLSIFIVALNLPFVYLAYRHIRRSFVFHMIPAIILFAFFLAILEYLPSFGADPLEAIVIGGAMLGAGAGL
ncbi:MAG: YitT family protein, partial [Chlamydiae bacterium]|nr:YitT family protein [Chlamydiota bacterium]